MKSLPAVHNEYRKPQFGGFVALDMATKGTG
jgi:hypothetical protein